VLQPSPMSGNPYGKDVFKHGSDDWHARKVMEADRAARHATPKPSTSPFSTHSPSMPNLGVGTPRAARPISGGSSAGGFGKFLGFVVVVIGFIAYFGSKSDSPQRSSPEANAEYSRTSDPLPPRREASDPAPGMSTTDVSTTGSATSSPSESSGASWTARLSRDDPKVMTAINDLKAASGQHFFVDETGTEVVLEQRPNAEGGLAQISFNIANLDLEARTYSQEQNNLIVPCKAANCIVYSLFDTAADVDHPPLKQRSLYGAVRIYAGSEEDMYRILDDLQALQSSAQ
jgi:hypothetical protein